jgi:hypothetical protein
LSAIRIPPPTASKYFLIAVLLPTAPPAIVDDARPSWLDDLAVMRRKGEVRASQRQTPVNAELVAFDSSGHYPFLEEPRLFSDVVGTFFQDTSTQRERRRRF